MHQGCKLPQTRATVFLILSVRHDPKRLASILLRDALDHRGMFAHPPSVIPLGDKDRDILHHHKLCICNRECTHLCQLHAEEFIYSQSMERSL